MPTAWMLRPVGIASMHFARHHRARRDALDVDDRRFGGDGDRLFDRADFQVGVDGRGEVGGQFDALALDGVEARQREGDRVECPAAGW